MKYLLFIFSILILPTIVFAQSFEFPEGQPIFDYDPVAEALGNQATQSSSIIDSNTGLPNGIEEQVSKKMSPEIPQPGQLVDLSVNIFSTNIDKAVISWYVDGSLKESGQGLKKYSVRAPQSGKTMNIRVTIDKENGGTLTETFTIAPAEVNILYEAKTYTPPLYKGASLFTNESVIRFVAEPNFIDTNGRKIDPKTLVYKWYKNDSIIANASGSGRQVFEYAGGAIQRDMKITVKVSAVRSPLTSENSVFIQEYSPQIVMYEKNPLYGILYEQAVAGSFSLDRTEVEFKAVPYYFSTKSDTDVSLAYNWFMNNQNIGVSRQKNIMTFRNTENAKGTAQVNVEIKNTDKIFQASRAGVKLDFSSSGGTDFNF